VTARPRASPDGRGRGANRGEGCVLGDSELILPMHRENDCGKAKDRGSIDAGATKACVIGILEGGKDAFMRRKEMYNH
jgi:hypothetical protein